jgi:hypothetical protein
MLGLLGTSETFSEVRYPASQDEAGENMIPTVATALLHKAKIN